MRFAKPFASTGKEGMNNWPAILNPIRLFHTLSFRWASLGISGRDDCEKIAWKGVRHFLHKPLDTRRQPVVVGPFKFTVEAPIHPVQQGNKRTTVTRLLSINLIQINSLAVAAD
jgi:hypothetical protein